MGTSFGTGHGAGVAAALFVQSKEGDFASVQKELVNQNAHFKLN